MKSIAIVLAALTLTACGTFTSDPYERREAEVRERQTKEVNTAIKQAPKWMTDLPTSNSAIYASGTSVSGDYSMALAKAKADAYGKICMGAGGTASQRTNVYRNDTENASAEFSEMFIQTQCQKVDITGVETKDTKLVAQGNRYRAYVLIALPLGEANIQLVRKEQMRLQGLAQQRALEMSKELD
jgi:hypothetical protein